LHKQNGFTDTTAANTRQMTKTSYHAHTPFKSEFVRRHARSQSVELLTDHTEHLMTQTLFICYGKLPLTSACWAFDLHPELLTVFNASLIIQ